MKRPLFHTFIVAVLAVSVVTLPACDGMFEGIYDKEPEAQESDFGFVRTDAATRSGTIYVDASSYTQWVYVDLHGLSCTTVAYAIDENEPGGSGEPVHWNLAEPDSWDFAIHRYDTKTAGGRVLETSYESLDALRSAGIPSGDYTEDEKDTGNRITVDMSHMMDGWLVYAVSDYNPVLSKWLDVDTSQMPPIYTMSKKVYVLEMQDGTHAALQLSNYMDASGVKGYMTVDYIYPL